MSKEMKQAAGVSDSLVDRLWANDELMSLNADFGLTLDQLHELAVAILPMRPQMVPMTDEQIRSMCKQDWVFETVKQWVRVIEAHHGISRTQEPT